MHEMGNHTDSHKISNLARAAGIGVRALSRKKASWSFLPPPEPMAVVANIDPPPPVLFPRVREREGWRALKQERAVLLGHSRATRPPKPTKTYNAPKTPPSPPHESETPVTTLAQINQAVNPTPKADELQDLRRRVAELEKLQRAKTALDELVALGYMTPLEAADKLFRTPTAER